MSHPAPVPLRAVVGAGVRRVRESAGMRQEDVAVAAREFGLPWSRAHVSHVEAGDKPVGVETVALLVGILTRVARRPVTVADLLDPTAHVTLSPAVTMTGQALTEVLAGARPAPEQVTRHPIAAPPQVRHDAERCAARRLGVSADAVAALAQQLWNRTFVSVRDELAAKLDPQARLDRRRSLRGRATTLLIREMRAALATRTEAGAADA